MHNPKTKRQSSQVLPRPSRARRIAKEITRPKHCCLNPVRSFGIVLGYEAPNVEEIVDGLGRELI